MVRRLSGSLVLALLLGIVAVAQEAASTPLQGRWVVVSGEHGGKPMNGITGGVMTVTGDSFEIRTASGNMLKGTLKLDTASRPFKMDLTHADGTVWEAVYEITSEGWRLNYVEQGEKDPRPAAFTTSEKTEESLVTLRRDDTQK